MPDKNPLLEIAETIRELPSRWDDRRGDEFDQLTSDERSTIQKRRSECLSVSGKLVISAILDFGWLNHPRFVDLHDKAQRARESERSRPYEQGAIQFLGSFVSWCHEHLDHFPKGAPSFRRLIFDNMSIPSAGLIRADLAQICESIAWILKAMAEPQRERSISDTIEQPPEAVPDVSSSTTEDAWLGHREIARRFGLKPENLRKRLERFRSSNHDCYREVAEGERRPSEPKFLYRIDLVMPVIKGMESASDADSKRPADVQPK